MLFIALVLLAALSLEGIGTWVSVIGLSALFAGSPIVIVLAVCLDFAKLVAVSFLYKNWNGINLLMKSYMTVATCVLILITSAGAFGFLSGEFQKSISTSNEQKVLITALTEEQTRLQTRKLEIDKQIAQLPEKNVRGRTTLMRQFGPEIDRINSRLVEIDKQLPQLKIDSIKKNVKIGPITYVAEVFGTTPEAAIKWIILVIIFVFDPLAVSLLVAANYLLTRREAEKSAVEKTLEDSVEDPPAQVMNVEEPPPVQIVVPEPVPVVEAVVEEVTVSVPEPETPPVTPAPVVKSSASDQVVPEKKSRRKLRESTVSVKPAETKKDAEPVVKSILENVDDSKGDVEMWATDTKRTDSKINNLYNSDRVGGGDPSGIPKK